MKCGRAWTRGWRCPRACELSPLAAWIRDCVCWAPGLHSHSPAWNSEKPKDSKVEPGHLGLYEVRFVTGGGQNIFNNLIFITYKYLAIGYVVLHGG